MIEEVNGVLKYDRKAEFATGVSFRQSFKGTLHNEKSVIVYRTNLREIQTITSDEDLSRARHPNIATLLYFTTDEDFRYDVVEQHAASLDCLFLRNDDPRKYTGPMPSRVQVLLQLANGLGYLHSLNILHGDIKPENILISLTKTSVTPVHMKWTGFGFTQLRPDSYSVTASVAKMNLRKWWPPEMYHTNQIAKKGEIFSTGCVFLYFLLDGLHPFGSADLDELEKNVREGKPVNLTGSNNEDANHCFVFVKKMIKNNSDKRISLRDLILRLENRPDLSKRFDFPSLEYEEKGYVNGRYSCGLYLSKPDRLAVKRIPIEFSASSALKKLNHSNIVRFRQCCHEELSHKYFIMEYYSASLDLLFLPEGNPKKYTGPMPSHEQFFIQLLNGLQYIHENSFVHGSIKPSNILINGIEDPQIKLSDFGLIVSRWDNINSDSAVLVSGFQSDYYWLAPELLTILRNLELNGTEILKPTRKSDIYSVGKVFFYYYYQSYAKILQPNKTEANMSDRNQEFVFKELPANNKDNKNRSSIYPIKLIKYMTQNDCESRLQLPEAFERSNSFKLTSTGELEKPKNSQKGSIQFSRDYILGSGSYGQVYLGIWSGSIAAVKRINITPRLQIVIERETELEQLDHCNVVKFYGYDQDSDFMHIAMERCLTSMDDYIRQPQLYHGVIPMPSDQIVLLQMATGLQYIHSKELIHRDVKPGNILLSCDNPTVIKWADFGVSKQMPEDRGEDGITWTTQQGTKGWKAPEVEKDVEKPKAGEKSDIFSLGCVFFFFLTPAIHPFGNNSDQRRDNIKSYSSVHEPTNIAALPKQNFAFAIIKEMIAFDVHSRPTISKVIEDLESAVCQ